MVPNDLGNTVVGRRVVLVGCEEGGSGQPYCADCVDCSLSDSETLSHCADSSFPTQSRLPNPGSCDALLHVRFYLYGIKYPKKMNNWRRSKVASSEGW